ncbi:hypothetical protein ACP4J4_20395 (plasmid) [Aureimonas ureilytica]|uniref:hypothetical protein n=1 Tax=Aureimonas ureilytica TaxID=401562 RepID=UPI003CFA7EF8
MKVGQPVTGGRSVLEGRWPASFDHFQEPELLQFGETGRDRFPPNTERFEIRVGDDEVAILVAALVAMLDLDPVENPTSHMG